MGNNFLTYGNDLLTLNTSLNYLYEKMNFTINPKVTNLTFHYEMLGKIDR